MHDVELILVLLAAVTLLAAVAERTAIPYPIFLVLGGLALALLPNAPVVQLNPDIVFLLLLPPILFSAAYDASWRDFRANLRPISQLAIGGVLFTTLAVAVVAHALIGGFTWPAAFVLGAIVAPPDAAAATAIFQRLGAPRRVVTVLEGESLVNDASALVAYRFAVAAVVTGSFSAWSAGGQFLLLAFGGIAAGMVAGWLMSRIIPAIGSPPVAVTASLLAPAAIYLGAERLGVSGVLATVVAGLVHGRSGAVIFDPTVRLGGETIWSFVVFVINGLVFILIGLQLRAIWSGLHGRTLAELAGASTAVVAAVIVTRFLWIYPATYLPRLLRQWRHRDCAPLPPWQNPLIESWSGLRGVVTLATALALPQATNTGALFPQRSFIIFLGFAVILATLVGQGLSLAPLLRWLGVATDQGEQREETLARRKAALAALRRLDDLEEEPWIPRDLAVRLRQHYQHVLEHLPESLDPAEFDREHVAAHERLRREMIDAQRQAIVALRDRGKIADESMRRIERDLDLEALRTEI